MASLKDRSQRPKPRPNQPDAANVLRHHCVIKHALRLLRPLLILNVRSLTLFFRPAQETLGVFILLGFAACDSERPQVAAVGPPTHLSPTADPQKGKYRARVEKLLHATPAGHTQMIMRPSFGPEFALSVRSQDATHVITVTEAKRSIWTHYYRGFDSESAPDEFELLRWDREIDPEFADAIHEAWLSKLHQVREPEHVQYGTDGVTFEFLAVDATGRRLRGEVWPPPITRNDSSDRSCDGDSIFL
jgi:hypothetical protein